MALNVFDTFARLGLDSSEYDRGMDRAGQKANTFADMLKANLVTKGIGAAVKGLAKLGSATKNLVSSAVDSYADYEQLVGGVETLFKSSANTVMKYAQNAYINAGLSANEYMETVTSFSASLIQSLGGDTAQAADLANLAIQDMSDNANKMGSDMSSIQNAYAGFAKQNYTMLDNLKLGYGGTKSEMDRLIKDAAKLDKTFKYGTKTVIKNKKAVQELDYTYADIIKAIHIVQTNMDITGTTAKEAEHTISGSLNMVKAAWRNLITAMGEGNEAKLDTIIDQLVYSGEKYLENMLPVAEKALYGVVHLLEALAPMLADKLPGILERVLPAVTSVTTTLLTAFTKALIANAPIILDGVRQILSAIYAQVQAEMPGLIPVLLGIGGAKVAGKGIGIAKDVTGILSKIGIAKSGAAAAEAAAGVSGAGAAAAGISGIAVAATAAVAALTALGITYTVYDGKFRELSKGEQEEAEKAVNTYQRLYETKGKKIADEWAKMAYGISTEGLSVAQAQQGLTLEVKKLWSDTPKSAWDALKSEWNKYFGENGKGFSGLIDDAIVNPVKTVVGNARDWGRDLIDNFIGGIQNMWGNLRNTLSNLAQTVRNFIGFSEPKEGPLSNFHTYAPDMMALFAKGITDNKSLVTKAINDTFDIGPRIASSVDFNAGSRQEYTVSRNSDQGNNVTIILKLADDTELGRAVYRIYNNEARRVGNRLAGGFA